MLLGKPLFPGKSTLDQIERIFVTMQFPKRELRIHSTVEFNLTESKYPSLKEMFHKVHIFTPCAHIPNHVIKTCSLTGIELHVPFPMRRDERHSQRSVNGFAHLKSGQEDLG